MNPTVTIRPTPQTPAARFRAWCARNVRSAT